MKISFGIGLCKINGKDLTRAARELQDLKHVIGFIFKADLLLVRTTEACNWFYL